MYQQTSMTRYRGSHKASPTLSTNIYDQITLTLLKKTTRLSFHITEVPPFAMDNSIRIIEGSRIKRMCFTY